MAEGKAIKFVQLDQAGNDRKVAINPAYVVSVTEGKPPETNSFVNLTAGDPIHVKGNLEEVQKKLLGKKKFNAG